MKQILLLLSLPLLSFFSLTAQITQQEADQIIIERLCNETGDFTIYAKEDVQTNFEIATSTGETIELAYPCWVYYADFNEETNGKYLIVKVSNGNLLEVNTKNDEGPEGVEEWRMVYEIPFSLWECTEYNNIFIAMKIYPAIHKLYIETIPDILGPSHTIPDSFARGIDYCIIDDRMYWKDPNAEEFIIYWLITYLSENEIRLKYGMPPLWPPTLIIYYTFLCQTEFNEI